jgi:hypothetical protein
MKNDVVVFAHVPKTAGSTMRGILRNQYPPHRVVTEKNLAFPDVLERIRQRLEPGGPGVDAICGHVGYGFHRQLPEAYRYRYFTFVRNPVDRVISNYYQWQRTGKIPPDLPFPTFVKDYPLGGQNLQTAFLSGHINGYFQEGTEDGGDVVGLMSEDLFAGVDRAEILQQAKTNLDAHDVVGLTERFDESLLLMARTFGWRWHRLPYLRQNIGHNRLPPSKIPEDVRDEIAAHNRLDLELYEHARALFARQMEAHGERMSRQLTNLRRVNRLMARVVPPLLPVLRPIHRRIQASR